MKPEKAVKQCIYAWRMDEKCKYFTAMKCDAVSPLMENVRFLREGPFEDSLHAIQLSCPIAIADRRLEGIADAEAQHAYDAVYIHDDGEGRDRRRTAIFEQKQIHDNAHDGAGNAAEEFA